jgi:AAA ATPase domain
MCVKPSLRPVAAACAVAYRSGMLLGRAAEQRELDLLIQHARAGTSGAIVLRGEPGIGKTALLGYVADRAASMRILRATGIEAEAELAFGGLYALLRPLANRLDAGPARYAALQGALGLGVTDCPRIAWRLPRPSMSCW